MSTEAAEPIVVAAGAGKSVWVVTDFITLKAPGEDTGGEYALIETTVNPQAGPPPHVHTRETETFYILEGELTFYMGEDTFKAGPGTFVKSVKGQLHTFKNETNAPARTLVWITPPGLEKFFDEVGVPATDSSHPPPVTPEVIGTLLAAGPKYGLIFPPPPQP